MLRDANGGDSLEQAAGHLVSRDEDDALDGRARVSDPQVLERAQLVQLRHQRGHARERSHVLLLVRIACAQVISARVEAGLGRVLRS